MELAERLIFIKHIKLLFMASAFTSRFIKIAVCFMALFILMFTFRYFSHESAASHADNSSYSNDYFNTVRDLKENYASEKVGYSKETLEMRAPAHDAIADIAIPQAAELTQQYEKTAEITSKTSRFDESTHWIRKQVKDFHALIQYEESTGLKGRRQLHLMIGIDPMLFDSLNTKIGKLGTLLSSTITKEDKTKEFRELNAKKASFEKVLASLSELKNKNGTINDYIQLHDKIHETESQLQQLGVDLGNFDPSNSFCTVKYSLYESGPGIKISNWHRAKEALEWTVQYYALAMLGLFLAAITILTLLVIIDKLQGLRSKQVK
jgi:hypothetical protein